MNIKEYLKNLKDESNRVFEQSLKFQDELGKAHHYSACVYEFAENVNDNSERNILIAVSSQMESATFNATIGMYRQAFSSLRLALEMGLGAAYFSIHKLELQEWLVGKTDIKWSSLIDDNDGVLSKRFANGFFEEFTGNISDYQKEAKEIYRKLSGYVHGNYETWGKSGLKLTYNEDLLKSYFESLKKVAEIVLYILRASLKTPDNNDDICDTPSQGGFCMSTPRQLSFCDLATRYEALSQRGDPLEALASHVPWETFRPTIAPVLHRATREKGGRPPFDALLMFKILVLQALYNLSDDQTEYQIRDRLSFMRFLGLDLDQRIPDAKTIWLFRETLTQAQVVETLFEKFEAYLAAHGLQPRSGQLIDASLVPVPTQRNSREENATIKAGKCPTEWDEQPAKRRQKDTEARWTKKHGASHYGYKNHVNVDKQHKLIRQYAVTDAAVHDSQVLEDVLLPAEAGRDIWADSAYRSEEIEAQLKAKGLRSKIHYKGYRHKALTAQQHTRNRGRSRIRARVEHVFGHQVTAMGGKLIRTIGLVRARAKIGLKNLTYNFQRFLILTMPRKVQEV